MTPIKTQALCLRTIDYSETSQVLRFYTRDLGKISCIAKGSKRKKSAFHGPFDILNVYEIVDLVRHSGSLDILTSAVNIAAFPRVGREYERFCAGNYVLEFIDGLTADGQLVGGLYSIAIGTLEALDRGEDISPTVFRFEARALRVLGYLPRTQTCGICEHPIGPEAYFGCRDGGAVCVRCRPRDPNRLLVTREVLHAVAHFSTDAEAPSLSLRSREMLRKVFDDYVRFVMEREPKSLRFMREAVLQERS